MDGAAPLNKMRSERADCLAKLSSMIRTARCGDGRLAQALEQCEENGWEALPLAAKELTRLYPDLWRTRKAAEDWARKNPLNPYNSTIRVWGVLNTYRPPRQTRWSKALVRHGADPRTALAAVLGVPAEAVRVRGQRAWASLR